MPKYTSKGPSISSIRSVMRERGEFDPGSLSDRYAGPSEEELSSIGELEIERQIGSIVLTKQTSKTVPQTTV